MLRTLFVENILVKAANGKPESRNQGRVSVGAFKSPGPAACEARLTGTSEFMN